MTKTFSIGDVVPNDHAPNTYEVEVSTYFGDADGYDKVVVGPITNVESLTDLIETLDRVDAEYPHGRGGGEEYSYQNVPGFYSWFGDSLVESSDDYYTAYPDITVDYATYLEHLALVEGREANWPYDPFTYSEQSLESYKVFYYDADCVQHVVTVSNG